MWSERFSRDDIAERCYQTCGKFKLLAWLGNANFEGCCTGGYLPTNPYCVNWESDGIHVDPLIKDGEQLLLFPKNKN